MTGAAWDGPDTAGTVHRLWRRMFPHRCPFQSSPTWEDQHWTCPECGQEYVSVHEFEYVDLAGEPGDCGPTWWEKTPMIDAAGDSPHTADTDPLIAVIAEALADKFLCRTIPLHRDKPEHLCRTCKADKARMAVAVAVAVRAHQNTTAQQTAAQAPPTDKSWIEMEGG